MTHSPGGNTEDEDDQKRPERAARATGRDGSSLRAAIQGLVRSVTRGAWRPVWPRYAWCRGASDGSLTLQTLAAMREGARSLADVQTMSECLDRIIQEMLKLPGVDCCGVFLPDANARVLRLAGHRGIGSALALDHAVLPLDSAFGAQMLGGMPSWYHDIGACRSGEGEGGERLRSVLVLPVRLQGELVAAVAIGSHVASRLPEVSCHAAELLALQAGGVLHRVKCREALAASEARLRLLLEHSVAAIAIVDDAGIFIQVNRRFEQLSGIGMDEVRGRQIRLREIIDRSELGGLEGWIHARVHSLEEADKFECELQTRAGQRVPVQLVAGRILWDDQACLFMSVREHLPAPGVEAPERPAPDPTAVAEPQMTQTFLQACDREREQVGRDLHDLLGSQLVGLAYLADGLARRLRREAPEQAGAALQLRDEAMLAHQQLRRVALALSPPFDAMEPLAAGLKRLCDNACLWPGIACRLENQAGDLAVKTDAANHLLCIAREAMANAVRHGKARCLVLSLACADGQGLLGIDDDGCGFAEDGPRKEGSGTHIMRFRAAALGGTLAINARPTGGVSVRCTFDGHRHVRNNAGQQ